MDLSLSYLFKGLNKDQLKKIEAIAEEVPIELGQTIIREGEKAKALYIVKSGAIELVTKVEKNFELPITCLRVAGDIFGSGVLVVPYQYTLTARCFKKGALLKFEKSALHKLMKSDRDMGCHVMKNLAEYLLLRLKESRHEIKIHFSTLLKSYR